MSIYPEPHDQASVENTSLPTDKDVDQVQLEEVICGLVRSELNRISARLETRTTHLNKIFAAVQSDLMEGTKKLSARVSMIQNMMLALMLLFLCGAAGAWYQSVQAPPPPPDKSWWSDPFAGYDLAGFMHGWYTQIAALITLSSWLDFSALYKQGISMVWVLFLSPFDE